MSPERSDAVGSTSRPVDDLEGLDGTWREQDALEFEAALAPLQHIDKGTQRLSAPTPLGP
jgi:hypothetical protein